jgi:lipopolysaccharide export system permease protein
LFVWPWTNSQTQKLRDQYEQRGDLERVSPGQFQESADGTRVFYIDKEPEQATQRSNIFIYEARGNRESILTAKSGQIETINQRQYLILNSGQRVVISDEGRNVEVSEFNRFGSLVKTSAVAGLSNDAPKSRTSAALLLAGDANSLAELTWRLGLGLAAFNFTLLGLALSAGANPRLGKSQNYLMAIFVFVTYYNLINVGQGWIAAGRISAVNWMILLHGSFLLVGAAFVAAKHNGWSWRSFLARHAQRRTR